MTLQALHVTYSPYWGCFDDVRFPDCALLCFVQGLAHGSSLQQASFVLS